jgi:hypothetical protein
MYDFLLYKQKSCLIIIKFNVIKIIANAEFMIISYKLMTNLIMKREEKL